MRSKNVTFVVLVVLACQPTVAAQAPTPSERRSDDCPLDIPIERDFKDILKRDAEAFLVARCLEKRLPRRKWSSATVRLQKSGVIVECFGFSTQMLENVPDVISSSFVSSVPSIRIVPTRNCPTCSVAMLHLGNVPKSFVEDDAISISKMCASITNEVQSNGFTVDPRSLKNEAMHCFVSTRWSPVVTNDPDLAAFAVFERYEVDVFPSRYATDEGSLRLSLEYVVRLRRKGSHKYREFRGDAATVSASVSGFESMEDPRRDLKLFGEVLDRIGVSLETR